MTSATARGRSPLLVRGAAVAALAAAAVTVAVVSFAKGGYEVTARFVDAGQLVTGDQVHLGAVPVGSVRRIRLEDDGTVAVRLHLTGPAAPLPQGTIARIRLDSLSGVANRYVSLDEPLAPRGVIPDGGTLPMTQTQSPVDLDALFNTFDAPTRRGLQRVFAGSAQQYDRRAAAARATLQRLAPALEGTGAFAEQITHDKPGFVKLLRGGAVATSALASRRAELTDLVEEAEVTTRALGDEQTALADALRRLPGALGHGSRTLAATRRALGDVTPLVRAAKPSAPRLPGFLDRLDTVLATGAGPLSRLAASVGRPGANNDLTDLLRGAPSFDHLSQTAFPRAIRTIDASRGQLSDLLAYTPDAIAALSHLGQVSANYDANGHYARVQPDLLAFTHDAGSNTLSLTPPGRALTTLSTRSGARCPGATIAPADGTSDRARPGCDPAAGVRAP